MTTRTISKRLWNAGLVTAVAVAALALGVPATASDTALVASSGGAGEFYFLPSVSCTSSTVCMAAGHFGGGVIPQGTVAQVWNRSTPASRLPHVWLSELRVVHLDGWIHEQRGEVINDRRDLERDGVEHRDHTESESVCR